MSAFVGISTQRGVGGVRYLDHFLSLAILMVTIPLLFLPKVNLIALGSQETAGIRIDDIILLAVSLIIVWARFAYRRQPFPEEKWFFSLVVLSFFSFAINYLFSVLGMLHASANILYCCRLIEYFSFFYIGIIAAPYLSLHRLLSVFLFFNALVMVLQWLGIIGEFSVEGYHAYSTTRLSGIASFPSEMGCLITMVFGYLVFTDAPSSPYLRLLPRALALYFRKTAIYWFFFFCALLVIKTGARIAIAALVAIMAVRVRQEFRSRDRFSVICAFLFSMIGCLVVAITIVNVDGLVERSKELLSMRNLDLITTVWERISLDYDPNGRESVAFSGNQDMSWWIRIHKWVYSLKMYLLHPFTYLQGVGPGFGLAAVDGGYIRILTEYGLIGSLLFFRFFSCLWRRSRSLRWMLIPLLINMVFFDAYLAYKPMSLLFIATGMVLYDQRALSEAGKEVL